MRRPVKFAVAAVPLLVWFLGCSGSTRHVMRLDFREPGIVKPNSVVDQPEIESRVEPEFPKELRKELQKRGTNAKVTLSILIRSTGEVTGIRVVESGGENFDQLAVQCVSRWRYKPARVDGVAKDVFTTVSLTWSVSS